MRRTVNMVAILAMLLVACAGAATPARADTESPKVVLVLDASGSMAKPDPSGGSKMDAAKKALNQAINAMPTNVQVGLRVYGADKDSQAAGSCQDSRLVHPVSTLDKPGLSAQIAKFKPRGDTPIAYAMSQAAADLGKGGKRHIILVSDGEETCAPDPCATVKQLNRDGVRIQIDTVGFGVGDKARKQLSCVAEAGGGTYYDAADGKALITSLEQLSARTARPYTVSGTPVTGGDSPVGAPELVAGQYTDTSSAAASDSTTKYYKIKRSIPGSTIRVSRVVRMPVASWDTSLERGSWQETLETLDGLDCASESERATDSAEIGVVLTSTLLALSRDPRVAEPEKKGCFEDETLIYSIKRREGADKNVPFELRVIEEPPVENAGDLPNGVAVDPWKLPDGITSPASGTPKQVTGGASFNDALEVESGTYTTEVVPGEVVFFKTKIGYGQSGVFALDGLQLSDAVRLRQDGRGDILSNLYAPDFSHMDLERPSTYTTFYTTQEGVNLSSPEISIVPEVRYRNRWDSEAMHNSDSRGFSMDGYYYYAVGLSKDKTLLGQPAQIQFSFEVKGEALDGPAATPSSDPSEPASKSGKPGESEESERPAGRAGFGGLPSWALYAGGGALALVGLGGVAFGLRKRMR